MTRNDHGPHARRELRDTFGWSMETLRYELAHQQAECVHTWGAGALRTPCARLGVLRGLLAIGD